jgi:hypothetical protein
MEYGRADEAKILGFEASHGRCHGQRESRESSRIISRDQAFAILPAAQYLKI